MNSITNAGRLPASLACAFLLAGCAAGGSPTLAPASPAPLVTPEVAAATPAQSSTAPAALAPSPQPSEPVYGDSSTAVAIHIEAPECVNPPDQTPKTTFVNGVRQMRDGGKHCLYDGADPRFSGWSDIVVSADIYAEDGSKTVRWGTERIPGPDGDWVGTYAGGSIGTGSGWRGNFEVLEGTGAYAGWTYVAYLDMAALGGTEWVVGGLIYHGPPPPVPPLPSPSSD